MGVRIGFSGSMTRALQGFRAPSGGRRVALADGGHTYARGFQGHIGMAIASSESSVPTDSPQATGSQQV